MGQSAYKITVEDGTTLEVKVDKSKHSDLWYYTYISWYG